jgi:hypothetical protein
MVRPDPGANVMPTSDTHPEEGATLATYWFAKLAAAVDRADFILATEAREQLRRLGFEVRSSAPPRHRRPRGGA